MYGVGDSIGFVGAAEPRSPDEPIPPQYPNNNILFISNNYPYFLLFIVEIIHMHEYHMMCSSK